MFTSLPLDLKPVASVGSLDADPADHVIHLGLEHDVGWRYAVGARLGLGNHESQGQGLRFGDDAYARRLESKVEAPHSAGAPSPVTTSRLAASVEVAVASHVSMLQPIWTSSLLRLQVYT